MEAIPYVIELKKIKDSSGSLTFAEYSNSIPFLIKRVYWIKDVPEQTTRGGHGHKSTEKVWVCLQGKLQVAVESPDNKKFEFILDRDENALYIPAGFWVTITFLDNAIFLCMASKEYDETDYIRDYNTFKNKNF